MQHCGHIKHGFFLGFWWGFRTHKTQVGHVRLLSFLGSAGFDVSVQVRFSGGPGGFTAPQFLHVIILPGGPGEFTAPRFWRRFAGFREFGVFRNST